MKRDDVYKLREAINKNSIIRVITSVVYLIINAIIHF